MDDKRLQDALEQVRNSREDAEKFAADPAAFLQSKGVDTDGLKFGQTTGELSDADLELAAGGMMAPTICTSVGGGAGVVVCESVGDSTDAS